MWCAHGQPRSSRSGDLLQSWGQPGAAAPAENCSRFGLLAFWLLKCCLFAHKGVKELLRSLRKYLSGSARRLKKQPGRGRQFVYIFSWHGLSPHLVAELCGSRKGQEEAWEPGCSQIAVLIVLWVISLPQFSLALNSNIIAVTCPSRLLRKLNS